MAAAMQKKEKMFDILDTLARVLPGPFFVLVIQV